MLHGIRRDRGDVAEAILIEVAHGQIAQVFCDFDTLGSASTVSAFGLPHAHDALGNGCTKEAYAHNSKRNPNDIHAELFNALQMPDDTLHHDCHGTNAERHEKGVENADDNGAVEFATVFGATELKEFIQNFKHFMPPPNPWR